MFIKELWKLPLDQIKIEFDLAVANKILIPGSWDWLVLSEYTNMQVGLKKQNKEITIEWVKLALYIQEKLLRKDIPRFKQDKIFLLLLSLRKTSILDNFFQASDPVYGMSSLENCFNTHLLRPKEYYFNLTETRLEQCIKLDKARKSENTELSKEILESINETSFIFRLILLLDDIDETLFSPDFQIQEWRAARARYHQKEIM
ncbi:MAG TPA: hypothetical protein DHW71_04755 [Gammaproteobacteria bacterium]|nr:hypothetical protein [Gammaproteobacteria bacterium]HBF09460.1 hypothetical protein [Gammaproteobacteria bacterium]HCK92272.1 hypothetical protein [Gammaproteobacteria bacterium]